MMPRSSRKATASVSRRSSRPILFLTTSDISLEAFHKGQFRYFTEQGFGPIEAASNDTGLLTAFGESEDVATHALPLRRNPSPIHDVRGLLAVIALLAARRPRMIVYGTPKAALFGSIAAALTGVPVRVQILHGLRFETVTGLLRRVLLLGERLVLRLSTATIAVSHPVRERAAELGLDIGCIQVIGRGSIAGVEVQRFASCGPRGRAFRAAHDVGSNEMVVGFVGRITRDKGVDSLVEAVRLLRAEGRPVRLLLVGPAEDLSSLRPETVRALSEEWIVATGPVADASEAFGAFDVACLPSYREGFAQVVLESWAARTPLVVSDAHSLKNTVEDGGTGLVVGIDDAQALQFALARCLAGGSATQNRVTRGFDLVSREFDRRIVWRRYLEALSGLDL